MKLTLEERETIITRSQAEHDWHVFTEDSRVIRKLVKLYGEGARSGSEGMEWTLPRQAVSFRKPLKLNVAQRAALADRLRAARVARAPAEP